MKLGATASSAAQRVWELVRGGGRRLAGRERFDALVGTLGLRALKARWLRFEKTMPDGSKIAYRAEDECIVDEVYADRVYDKDSPIEAGQCVIDAGGHIGAFALYAARKVGPEGRVVVFEPSPDNLELLRRNLDANALSQIRLFPVGLAEAAGQAQIYVAEPGADNPAANTLFPTEGRRGTGVPLERLDDVVERIGLARVDLLKIDVEGAELRVLRGAEKTLKLTRRIVMEIHPARVEPAEVAHFLEKRGFTLRTLFQTPLIIEALARR